MIEIEQKKLELIESYEMKEKWNDYVWFGQMASLLIYISYLVELIFKIDFPTCKKLETKKQYQLQVFFTLVRLVFYWE